MFEGEEIIMTMSVDDKLTVQLAETLDVSAVKALHAELTTAVDKGAHLILDGSKVGRIDTAAVQLIAALFVRADARRIKVEWHAPSETIAGAAALLGMSRHIGLNEI